MIVRIISTLQIVNSSTFVNNLVYIESEFVVNALGAQGISLLTLSEDPMTINHNNQ